MSLTKEQIDTEVDGCYGIPSPFWATVIERKGRLEGLLDGNHLVWSEPIRDLALPLFERMLSELEITQMQLSATQKDLTVVTLKLRELTAAQIDHLDPDNS